MTASFPDRLRELREEAGLSRLKLGVVLGGGDPMDPSQIVRWETGRNSPRLETLLALAEVFGVSLDYLTGLSDSRDIASAQNGSDGGPSLDAPAAIAAAAEASESGERRRQDRRHRDRRTR